MLCLFWIISIKSRYLGSPSVIQAPTGHTLMKFTLPHVCNMLIQSCHHNNSHFLAYLGSWLSPFFPLSAHLCSKHFGFPWKTLVGHTSTLQAHDVTWIPLSKLLISKPKIKSRLLIRIIIHLLTMDNRLDSPHGSILVTIQIQTIFCGWVKCSCSKTLWEWQLWRIYASLKVIIAYNTF